MIFSGGIVKRITAVDPHNSSAGNGSKKTPEDKRNCVKECNQWNSKPCADIVHDTSRLEIVCQEFD